MLKGCPWKWRSYLKIWRKDPNHSGGGLECREGINWRFGAQGPRQRRRWTGMQRGYYPESLAPQDPDNSRG